MKSVLVIREFGTFSEALNDAGLETIELPLIKIEPVEVDAKDLQNHDAVFITSRHAAMFLRENIGRFSGEIYILGERSFEILCDLSNEKIYFADANDADELFSLLDKNKLRQKNVLYICGDKSTKTIAKNLSVIAHYNELVVYANKTVEPENGKFAEVVGAISRREISAVCFFSPSGYFAFREVFGDKGDELNFAAIGKTTAKAITDSGRYVWMVSSRSTARDFAAELIKNLENE